MPDDQKPFSGYRIVTADPGDAEEILQLQKLAYWSEAAIIDDYTIEPLVQTLGEKQTEFGDQVFLKALYNGRIIGSVKAYEEEGTCYIGKVIVCPDLQNRGIGKCLMKQIEQRFRTVSRYELFTGALSKRNIAFYEKCGYRIFDERKISEKLSLVFMEKPKRRVEG
ncbi:GNAT family N-acetyltransferase [bacterium]|nr:GNAT family N-acetyltransferase [bacterium]